MHTTNLINFYNTLVKTSSDINEHLPVLKNYGSQCKHITEMGVRRVISSFAFAISNPKTLKLIDIHHPDYYNGSENLNLISNYCLENNINFEFILGNSLSIDIEQTDLLFIDTLHIYQQLKMELDRHAKQVNKYIILHDTVLFGHQDDRTDYPHLSYTEKIETGPIKGLWPALQEFLIKNNEWHMLEHFTNNNGLTILERVNK